MHYIYVPLKIVCLFPTPNNKTHFSSLVICTISARKRAAAAAAAAATAAAATAAAAASEDDEHDDEDEAEDEDDAAATKKAKLSSSSYTGGNGRVEIVFSFDTTGSMYACLAEVRRKIQVNNGNGMQWDISESTLCPRM